MTKSKPATSASQGMGFLVPDVSSMYHLGKMSSVYGENHSFWKSRLPELSDNHDTSQHYFISRSLTMSHCLICKFPYFNDNIESSLILVTQEAAPKAGRGNYFTVLISDYKLE